MTVLGLFGIICAALLLQVATVAGVWVWRRRHAVEGLAQGGRVEPRVSVSKGAWPGWRDFRVVRREFEDAARSQCSFSLAPVDGGALPPFQPGQYLTFALQIGDEPADSGRGAEGEGSAGSAASASGPHRPRSITRCYSLSDRPDPAAFRITVKRALPPPDRPELPPGASSNHLHDRVHEGDVLQVKAPAGHFFIDPDASVPAVFVAGGIGITPMMSMLRWCVAEQPERPVHLFYGVRNSADHAFKAVLEDLARAHAKFRLHVVYSNPAPGDALGRDHQHAGRVDLGLLRDSLPHGRHQFYVCGPPAMMRSLVPALREWGVREEDIHFEAFGPATARPATLAAAATAATNEPSSAASTSIDIRFSRSGRTLTWDGQDANLLDFAERHGVAVDSGCRSGSCGSCETRLASGSVDYAERPDHDVAPGHCLLCVGKPQSALVLEA